MRDTRHAQRTAELCEILWNFIQDLNKVNALKKRPSLEQRMKVSHAVSQLAAAYLKVAEADLLVGTVPDLQDRLRLLRTESSNGHADVGASAPPA